MPQNSFPWNNPNGLREGAQPNEAYNTDTSIVAHVLTAAHLTGGFGSVTLDLTGTLAAGETATTDTAANIVAAIPNAYPGYNYRLRIVNDSSGAFAWTIAAGSGVTITGTLTIAQHTWREWIVTVQPGATPTVTWQAVGTGTNS